MNTTLGARICGELVSAVKAPWVVSRDSSGGPAVVESFGQRFKRRVGQGILCLGGLSGDALARIVVVVTLALVAIPCILEATLEAAYVFGKRRMNPQLQIEVRPASSVTSTVPWNSEKKAAVERIRHEVSRLKIFIKK